MIKKIAKTYNKCKLVVYQILFIDQETCKPSHSKFWANVASAVLVWAFLHMYSQGVDYWFAIGTILIGGHLGNRYINSRSGITIESDTDDKK